MTEPVYVVDPVGRARVASTDENKALAAEHDATVLSPEAAAHLYQQEQDQDYVDKTYGTGGKLAMGAASGLTLGLAPAAGVKLAEMVDPEAAELGRRDLRAMQGSGAYMAGELGGALLPVIFSGGLAGTPMGLAGRAGGMAESLAARVLPESAGLLGKGASTALQMASRGAAEGALMNLGQTASNSVIWNKPLTAEALAASGAEGALFGGLVGGGLGTAGALLGRGAEAAVGGYLGKAGESGVTRAEALAGKQLGAIGEDFKKMGAVAGEDGVKRSLTEFHDILAKEGESFASRTGRINEVAQKTVKESEAVQQGIVDTLSREAPGHVPSAARINSRLVTEVAEPYVGSFQQDLVAGVVDDTMNKIANVAGSLPGLEVGAGAKAGKVWDAWYKTRYQLADSLGKSGVASDIRSKILNVLDDEMMTSMRQAEGVIGKKGLAEAYASAAHTRATAEHLAEMTERKVLGDISNARGVLTPQDIGQAIGGASFGHPLWAGGMLAAKALTRKFEGVVAPKLAEMAFQSSIGTGAAAATAGFQQRIQKAVKGFFNSTKAGASYVNAKARSAAGNPAFNVPKTRDEYDRRVEATQELLSPNHAARVTEYVDALNRAGQPELGKSVQEMYGRAVQYMQANTPMSKSVKGSMSLGPMPKFHGLDLKDYKFLRLSEVVTKPTALLDRIESGTVSKEEMDAFKSVYPEAHGEMVANVQQSIVDMKSEGKFLPADKIVSLGIMLGAEVDPMLSKGFIDAVQASFAPPQDAPSEAPPPDKSVIATAENLQTPLERTLT